MGLFSSIIKGDVHYFNKTAIPVLSKISNRIEALPEISEKRFLLRALHCATAGIDLLFHPQYGVITNQVQNFDQDAFYRIYESLIIFAILTHKSTKPKEIMRIYSLFVEVIDRPKECDAIFGLLSEDTSTEVIWGIVGEHLDKSVMDLEKQTRFTFGLMRINSELFYMK